MPITDVTLEWKLAKCDEPECEWEGNPTPDPDSAQGQLDAHQADAHAEDPEATP